MKFPRWMPKWCQWMIWVVGFMVDFAPSLLLQRIPSGGSSSQLALKYKNRNLSKT